MQESADAKEAIKAARLATNKAIAERDIESLSKYFFNDIIIVRGNGNAIITKQDAIKVWEKIFSEEPIVSYERDSDEILINNNNLLAWEKGNWQGNNSKGNYAAMWCYENDMWKLKAELFVAL